MCLIERRFSSVIAICVILLGLLVPVAASAAGSATTLRFSRDRAASGDQVIITGSGFSANATVIVSSTFDVGGKQQQVQTSAQAGASGGFTASLTVPANTVASAYTIKAR